MAGYHFSLHLIFLNCPQVPLFVFVMYVIEMLVCFLSGYFYFSQFSGHFPVSKTLLLDVLALAPQSKTNNSLFSATAFLKKNKKEDVLFKESWFFQEYVENALIDGLTICCKVQTLLLMSCDLSYWQILWDLGWVVKSSTTCKLNQD